MISKTLIRIMVEAILLLLRTNADMSIPGSINHKRHKDKFMELVEQYYKDGFQKEYEELDIG